METSPFLGSVSYSDLSNSTKISQKRLVVSYKVSLINHTKWDSNMYSVAQIYLVRGSSRDSAPSLHTLLYSFMGKDI